MPKIVEPPKRKLSARDQAAYALWRKKRRESLFIRVTVGTLCATMFIIVMSEIISSTASYATHDYDSRFNRPIGRFNVSSLQGLTAYFMAAGFPSLVGVIGAIRPELVMNNLVLVPAAAITISSAVILKFSN